MSNKPSSVVSILNPQIPVDQSIYEESTTQKARLGTKLEVGERVFRYGCAGTTLAAGTLYFAPAASAGFSSANLTVASTAAGAKIVTCTSTSMAAVNAFADGNLCIGLNTGKGMMYRVKSNAAGTSGFKVTLYDELATNITATAKVELLANKYNGVIISETSYPAGVPNIAVTSGNYVWLQTKGLGPAVHAAANAALCGLIAGTSGTVTAALQATANATAAVTPVVAYNVDRAAVATEANVVIWALE